MRGRSLWVDQEETGGKTASKAQFKGDGTDGTDKIFRESEKTKQQQWKSGN